jgi:hypothetical protein
MAYAATGLGVRVSTIRVGVNGQGVAVSYDYGVNDKMGYLWSGCQ